MPEVSLVETCKLGRDLLIEEFKAGRLGLKEAWTALKGAETYIETVASGDIATPEVSALRAGMQCANCNGHKQRHTGRLVAGSDLYAITCGDPFVENIDSPEPTCGCLVAISVNGRIHAAGKTVVRTERCPRGLW